MLDVISCRAYEGKRGNKQRRGGWREKLPNDLKSCDGIYVKKGHLRYLLFSER